MILTEAQIKAQIRALRKKSKSTATAFALRSDVPWTGASRLVIDNQGHRIAFCRSDLELREQLRAAKLEGEPLVALCAFSTSALGDDVKARLARQSVQPPDAKEILGSLFQATAVDGRILKQQGLSQALVAHAPADGYTPVAGGVLDLQTAWLEVIDRVVGNREVAMSTGRLLEATLDPLYRQRLDQMDAVLRNEFFAWLSLNVDQSAAWMNHLVSAGKAADLIPLGLMLDVAFDQSYSGNTQVAAAHVRLESWFAGHAIGPNVARVWAAAARTVVQSLFQKPEMKLGLGAVLNRFDVLLVEFKIGELAVKSDFSPAGFEQRVKIFAQALTHFAKPGVASSRDVKKLIVAIDGLRSHMLANEHLPRIDRCQMAARLACWVSEGASLAKGTSLEEMVEGYARVGGFVDWARTIVQEGDAEPALNKAFDAIITCAASVCHEFEANFALKLAEWTAFGGKPAGAFLPIEDALENLVGPVAAQAPVLLLVMDGMSIAVFRELLGDMVQRGKWLECRPGEIPMPSALLATVPSVTEISRRALFRGKLHPESTPTEQSAFSGNDRLFSLCGGQSRPVLILKGGLQTAGEAGLAAEVKSAVANTKCRVVATVVNAIDDHLSGSDQIAPRWDLNFVRQLPELLQLAADAGRVIILTSDHGHVLELQTVLKSGMTVGGDRYREDGGMPVDGEIKISGTRVRQAMGHGEVIAAWSKNVRYAGKKRGYHGGASPQEVVVPLAILRHLGGATPKGWTDVSPSPFWPEWWRLTAESATSATVRVESERTTKLTAGLDLFAHAAAANQGHQWIDALLNGEIYAIQSKQGVRGAVDRKEVASFLEIMESRGGSLPREALAERLGLPVLRLNGHVANLARVFNVDGYDVLTMDAASGTIVLNIALLKKQFALAD